MENPPNGPISGQEGVKVQEVIVKNQIRLDIRRFLAIGVAIILLKLFGFPIPLWIAGSLVIGLVLGLVGGYLLYKPYDIIVIDTRKFPEQIAVELRPRSHRKRPDETKIVKTVTEGGMDVIIYTNLALDSETEFQVTVEAYQKLVKRYEQVLQRLRVLERELDLKALEKARQVLKDYLEARRRLLEERKGEI